MKFRFSSIDPSSSLLPVLVAAALLMFSSILPGGPASGSLVL